MTEMVLGVRLVADADGFRGELKLSREQLDQLGQAGQRTAQGTRSAGDAASRAAQQHRGMGSALAAARRQVVALATAWFSLRGVERLLRGIHRETERTLRVSARLDAVLRATGHAAGFTREQLERLIDELVRATTLDDDTLRQGIAVMATFRSVQGETFREGIRLAADLAELLGGDLQAAIMQIGRALDDPARGMDALRRAGVSFSAQQREVIQQLQETGRLGEAQQVILTGLRERIGGTAEGVNTGLVGATAELSRSWGDMLKALGQTETIGGMIVRAFLGIAGALREVEAAARRTPLAIAVAELEQVREEIARRRPTITSGAIRRGDSGRVPEALRRREEEAASRVAALEREAEDRELGQLLRQGEVRPAGHGEAEEAARQRQLEEMRAFAREMSEAMAAQIAEQEAAARRFLDATTEQWLEATGQQLELIVRRRDADLAALDDMRLSEQEAAQARVMINAMAAAEIGRVHEAAVREQSEQSRRALEFLDQAAGRAFDRIGGAMTDMAVRGKEAFGDLRNIGLAVVSELHQAFLELAVINPVRNSLFGQALPTLASLAGGLLGGGAPFIERQAGNVAMMSLDFHRGGVVGRDGDNPRRLPAALWEDAPRLHRGGQILAPGEVAAVLRYEEEVLTPDNPRHVRNAGRGGQTINIFPDLRGASAEAVEALHRMVRTLDASIGPRSVAAVVGARRRNPRLFGAAGAV